MPGEGTAPKRLFEIAHEQRVDNFHAASEVMKLEVSEKWIISISESLKNPIDVNINKDAAYSINEDILELEGIFDVVVSGNRYFRDTGEKLEAARKQVLVALEVFEKERQVESTDLIGDRIDAFLKCRRFLREALEYIRAYNANKFQEPKPMPIQLGSNRIASSPSKPSPSKIRAKQPSQKGLKPMSDSLGSSSIRKALSQVDRNKLKDAMIKAYKSGEEVEELCLELKVPYEKVKAKRLSLAITRLIDQAELTNLYEQLIERVLEQYPKLKNEL